MMKKNFKLYCVAWAVFVALFNAGCFLIPSRGMGMYKFGGAFWSGYIFIMLAFIGQLVCSYFAFKADSLKKMFYNIPLITSSYTGLVLSVIIGGLCMFIPDVPNWVGAVVCMIVLAFSAVSVIKAKAAGDIVEDIDKKISRQTEFIKTATLDAQNIMNGAKSEEAKAECKKVYEALRYSDPMSNAALVETEEQLGREFENFAKFVRVGDDFAAKNAAAELLMTIDRRNKKCKVLK